MRGVPFVGRAPIAGLLRLFCIGARRASDGGMCAFFGSANNQQIEKGHAHSDAVRHLLKDAGLGAISDLGRNLGAAIHRTRMENDSIRLGAAEAFGVELVKEHVIRCGKGRFVETLGLDAEDEDNVGAFEGFFDTEDAANGSGGRTDFFELAGDPHSGTAECEAAAEFSKEMDIGAGDTAVLDVAEDGDAEIFDGTLAIADGESVEQALRGMLVGAVAGVDDGNIEMARDKIRRARGGVAHDETVGLHGVESVNGIEEGFALFQAGGFGLKVHGVGAQTRGGRAEADARARGIFEEGEGDGFAAEGGEFFQRMTLNFLEGLALIEKKGEFVRGERFEGEKIAEVARHSLTRCTAFESFQ
jgi:hypothetical protein